MEKRRRHESPEDGNSRERTRQNIMWMTMFIAATYLSSVFLCGGGGQNKDMKKKEPDKVEMKKAK